jgi:hypothetical protein
MSFLYQSEQEMEQVVRGFETCTMPAADFHHREHLTVAVWYLQTLSRGEAVDRMRAALLRFLDHYGVDPKKYSEEVTVFWVDAVARCLEGIKADASQVDKCNSVIAEFCSLERSGDGSSSTVHKPAARVADEESLVKS